MPSAHRNTAPLSQYLVRRDTLTIGVGKSGSFVTWSVTCLRDKPSILAISLVSIAAGRKTIVLILFPPMRETLQAISPSPKQGDDEPSLCPSPLVAVVSLQAHCVNEEKDAQRRDVEQSKELRAPFALVRAAQGARLMVLRSSLALRCSARCPWAGTLALYQCSNECSSLRYSNQCPIATDVSRARRKPHARGCAPMKR